MLSSYLVSLFFGDNDFEQLYGFKEESIVPEVEISILINGVDFHTVSFHTKKIAKVLSPSAIWWASLNSRRLISN